LTIYLVRHAKAESRTSWNRPDPMRPLTARGQRQAQGLVEQLAGAPLQRLVSSPHVRCRQTLEPLAAARRLPLEIDERLAEGKRVEDALDLVRGLRGAPAVLCSHGDLIPAILEELELRGLAIDGELRCEKGSVWVLEGRGSKPGRARYLAPSESDAEASARPPGASSRWICREPQRIAVLDLGSTSFHLLVADATPEGAIEPVLRERIQLRLGAVIANDERIPEDVCRRAVETARWLGAAADRAGAELILPVATAALRTARNSAALAERIGAALEEPVRLLAGAEEARVIHAALRRRVAVGPDPILAIDLGGGSLELAVDEATEVCWETTLPLGVAWLHRKLVFSDPMRKGEQERIRKQVEKSVRVAETEIARWKPGRCVATGGTLRALARLVLAQRGRPESGEIRGLRIPREELDGLTTDLANSSHAQRLRMPGMKRRRADLLPTGALVLSALAGALGLEEYVISDWGLREGVILEAFGLASAEAPER
jgi:exopolyphosphatase/guanosine-5'-triphosphate,3'-diphosphate pyrophosphatase